MMTLNGMGWEYCKEWINHTNTDIRNIYKNVYISHWFLNLFLRPDEKSEIDLTLAYTQ